jgi:hypothetical protein
MERVEPTGLFYKGFVNYDIGNCYLKNVVRSVIVKQKRQLRTGGISSATCRRLFRPHRRGCVRLSGTEPDTDSCDDVITPVVLHASARENKLGLFLLRNVARPV